MEKFSIENFEISKKYFLTEFFSNIKSLLSAFKRDQLELLGLSEREATHETIHRPPLVPKVKSPSS